MTNSEFLTNMMSFSDAGGLKEVFIIEAIYKYSQLTLDDKKWPDNTIIDQTAWKICAQECLDAIIERNQPLGALYETGPL